MNALPELPPHPDHHAMTWTVLEQLVIAEYGALCRKAALEEAIEKIEMANADRTIYITDCIEILGSLK